MTTYIIAFLRNANQAKILIYKGSRHFSTFFLNPKTTYSEQHRLLVAQPNRLCYKREDRNLTNDKNR